MNEKYGPILENFQFNNGVELKNRVVMAPMTNYSSNKDGTVSDEEVNYYIRRSKGVSMVITACTYVTPNGQGFPGEFAGHTDEMIPSLQRLATAIKNEGSKAILQIFHAGRQVPKNIAPNGDVVSASAIAYPTEGKPIPRALTEVEVEGIIHDFGETTRRAIQAGYNGVEIHGANTYLIQQFFSPHSNRRSDRFGGSLEKRMTFPLAVVDEVQRVVKEHASDSFIIGYRFSPEEHDEPGITMADTLALVNKLANKNLDYLHVSLTDFWSKPNKGFDGTRSRIELLQDSIGDRVPLIGVGSIYTAEDARKALASGIPLIGLGRELLIDPEWVQKIENGREDEIVTELAIDKQNELDMPSPLWQRILNNPGWVPGI